MLMRLKTKLLHFAWVNLYQSNKEIINTFNDNENKKKTNYFFFGIVL